MNEVEIQTQKLSSAILESETYTQYLQSEEKLREDPELWNRVELFRRENFFFQQNPAPDPEESGKLMAESAALHRIPAAGEYLDAEMAVCKMIQRICRRLTDIVEVSIPQI